MSAVCRIVSRTSTPSSSGASKWFRHDAVATTAIEAAMEDVRTTRSQPVPEHLRSGGDHTHPEGKQPLAAPGFMTTPKVYYHPSDSGFEAEISKRLKGSP